MRGEGCFDGGEIVVRECQREVRDGFRNSSGTGYAEGGDTGAGFDEQSVGVAVIAAFKLDDDVAAGGGAGEANGRHGGLSAGADEAHFFDGRIAGNDALGEIGFSSGGGSEAGGVARGALNGFNDGREGVAEDHRSP